MSQKSRFIVIILIILLLLLIILIYGVFVNVQSGVGFLFIPSNSYTPTITATQTITPTVTFTPSKTLDLNLLKTNAVNTYIAGNLIQTQNQLNIATSTGTPDVSVIRTEAVNRAITELTETEMVVRETEKWMPQINSKGFTEKILGKDQSIMVLIDDVSRPFWIDKYEVTNASYQKCIKDGNCSIIDSNVGEEISQDTFNSLPVVNVSWNHAKDYCEWAGKRLPTKDEWLEAAGVDKDYLYPWGKRVSERMPVNANGENGKPVAANTYPEGCSFYGVCNLLGNVWEWVFSSNPELDSEQQSIMGGGWRTFSGDLNNRIEGKMNKTESADDVGFRCASDIE